MRLVRTDWPADDYAGWETFNEYGTPVSLHVCATCGSWFYLCPPSTTFGPDCLASECPSYDPARDAEVYFLPDDPALIEPGR